MGDQMTGLLGGGRRAMIFKVSLLTNQIPEEVAFGKLAH